ncbi:amino acid ABC transporter ATP-binding protein [Sediminispirochaeta bajacaliforniensis]|uniref:amino acid ABC transporter ATP-binding protein n=1 Tax=Sediminispirochaeta bajacaliforniensis TaxID=148 RepID=UPI000379B295|nr:amino acid ABC transporter ATP-binding protein [Sediminispirochaeta bajacaliforniensis]
MEQDKRVVVEFKDVVKQFEDDLVVLDHLNMKFYDGETHVLCGRSGAGKSTLIRCINYLESINAGEILVEGEAVTKKRARAIRKKCGMVFQSFNLFPHMTVLENALLGPMKSLNKQKAEIIEKVESYFHKVGLAEKMKALPGELSGGQKQRAAIVRALAMEPDLILFDEPTSALDPEMIGEVLNVMKQLSDEGRTMLVVTHEMGFAREAADKISFMDAGKIVATKTPVDFFHDPGHESVERFLKQIL